MSRYRDDSSRDDRDRDPRNSRDDGSTEDRYRGGGHARSFAEERFNEAQRNAPERGQEDRSREAYERENYERARQNFDRDRSSQFDYGETRQQDKPRAGDERNDRMRGDRGYAANADSQYNDSRGEPYRDELAAREGDARHFYRGEEENRRVRYEEERNPRGEISNRGGGRPGGSTASRSHVRCRDIMTRDVTVATRDTTLQEVAAMMRDEDTGVIPVVENANDSAMTANASTPNISALTAASTPVATETTTATVDTLQAANDSGDAARSGGNAARGNAPLGGYGKLVGLITDRDIVIRAIAEGKDATTTRAADIMTEQVYTAQPNDRVIDAIREMGDKQVRRIPVCDRDGKLRGIISMADVALETEEDSELAKALEEISSGASFWGKMFG